MGYDDEQQDAEAARLQEAGPEREAVLGSLLDGHRARLVRMVEVRMDPRLRARLDASDVIQDAFLEAHRRLPDYLDDPRMPFFLWLRFITAQRLVALYRYHLGAQRRDVRRQVRMGHGVFPEATSVVLADRLLAGGTTPTTGAARHEMRAQLEAFLDRLKPDDREVLALRHFEELSNQEAARELGIGEAAASKRYLRALGRLRDLLEELGRDTEAQDA